MSDMSTLEQRIREKLAAADEQAQRQHNHFHERMLAFEERHQRYVNVADRLMRTVICPRMRKLREFFKHAEFPEPEQAGKHSSVCSLPRTPRFPATTKLELAVSRDGQCETLQVLYSLDILPVFFQFDGRDQLSMPLDDVEDDRVAAWVDDKLVQFVETYLRLEVVEQYQEENLVTDPVCGMRINKAFAPAQMDYQGQTYYFCVQDCRKKFAADPARYLTGI
jgi:YHS domain-containing protein